MVRVLGTAEQWWGWLKDKSRTSRCHLWEGLLKGAGGVVGAFFAAVFLILLLSVIRWPFGGLVDRTASFRKIAGTHVVLRVAPRVRAFASVASESNNDLRVWREIAPDSEAVLEAPRSWKGVYLLLRVENDEPVPLKEVRFIVYLPSGARASNQSGWRQEVLNMGNVSRLVAVVSDAIVPNESRELVYEAFKYVPVYLELAEHKPYEFECEMICSDFSESWKGRFSINYES